MKKRETRWKCSKRVGKNEKRNGSIEKNQMVSRYKEEMTKVKNTVYDATYYEKRQKQRIIDEKIIKQGNKRKERTPPSGNSMKKQKKKENKMDSDDYQENTTIQTQLF